MGTGNTDLGGDYQRYSNIDLENVDSWLPPEVAQSLARMIAARNRKQLEESIAASSYAYDVDSRSVARDDSSSADGDYRTLLRPDLPILTGSGSSEVDSGVAEVPSRVPHGEVTEGDSAGGDDFSGDGIPFF